MASNKVHGSLMSYAKNLETKASHYFKTITPDRVLDTPMNFLFDVVLSTICKKVVFFLLWFCLRLFPFLFVIGVTSFVMGLDYESELLQGIFIALDLPILIIVLRSSAGMIIAPLYDSYGGIRDKLKNTSFRKIANQGNGQYLKYTAICAVVFFVFLFLTATEDSGGFHLFALLLSLVIFWFCWFFSKFKDSAQIAFVALISAPFLYSYVESHPEKFPNSIIHQQKIEVVTAVSPNKTYLDLYLAKYGLTACYEKCNGVDNNLKLNYTLYNVEDELVFTDVKYAKAAVQGARLGTKIVVRRLGSGLSKAFKFATRPLVRVAKPIRLKVIKPVQRSIARAVARPARQLQQKVGKLRNEFSTKLAKSQKQMASRADVLSQRVKQTWTNAKKNAFGTKQNIARLKQKFQQAFNSVKTKLAPVKNKVVNFFNTYKVETRLGSGFGGVKIAKNSPKSNTDLANINAKSNQQIKARGKSQQAKLEAENLRKMEAKKQRVMAEMANRRDLLRQDGLARRQQYSRLTPDQKLKLKEKDGIAKDVTRATTRSDSTKSVGEFTFQQSNPNRATSELSRQDHFNKHKMEFINKDGSLMYKNVDDYTKGALKLLNNPHKGVLTRTLKNGDISRFNPKTGEFAVMTDKGSIRTYFRPGPESNLRPNGYDPVKYNSAKEYFYGLKIGWR